MTRIIRLYGQFLRSWLTVVVYLWLLQLIAAFGIHDLEPLLDRLADWSAILWTLVFWMALAVFVMGLIVLFVNQRMALVLNDRGAKAALILVTAFYFVRWLFRWATILGDTEAVTFTLVIVCLVIGVWVWRRRKNGRQDKLSDLSLFDGWYYIALPVLITSALILAVKVRDNSTVLKANQMVVSRAASLPVPQAASQPRPNVVLIVADSLRAQNMSLYGYGRETSPFLNRFAESSSVFTHMYSNSTTTRVSITTILSGKHPFSHGRLTRFLPPYNSFENLVTLLRDKGYTTAAVTSNLEASFHYLALTEYLVYGQFANFNRLTLSWLRDNGVYPTLPGNRMYDELSQFLPFLGFPEKTLDYGPADGTFNRAARLLVHLPEPFFLFVHVHEPHSPYETPVPFRGKYSKLDYREVNQKISSAHSARYPPELQPFVDAHRDHYDEAIEYLDSELEGFLRALADNPKTRNSLLIITSDHGESFERGFFIHGDDLYESSVHVPLLIKYPNQDRGAKLTLPVQSIDIAPTILRVIDVPIPTWMDGKPVTSGTSLEERETIMINYKEPNNGRVYDRPTKLAIRWKQYKLIANCDSQRAELYDVVFDPGEQANLARREAGLVKGLWGRLEQHLAKLGSDRRMVCNLNS